MASSKCWFVLRHTHYPPPTFPDNGVGQSRGPICLGHLIPDLQHLDNVINRHGPQEFPPDMPAYLTQARNFNWQSEKDRGVDLSAEVGLPIATAVGVMAKGSASVAFRRSVSNFSEFKSLDTFIVQVTPSYIEDALDAEEVSEYVRKHTKFGTWSMFMITGIIVAKGGRVSASEGGKKGIGGGPGVEVPGVAEVQLNLKAWAENNSLAVSSEQVSDFVWAVRLAKISKGFLDREWSYSTFSKGATYGLEDEEFGKGVTESLSKEGIRGAELITADDELFVL